MVHGFEVAIGKLVAALGIRVQAGLLAKVPLGVVGHLVALQVAAFLAGAGVARALAALVVFDVAVLLGKPLGEGDGDVTCFDYHGAAGEVRAEIRLPFPLGLWPSCRVAAASHARLAPPPGLVHVGCFQLLAHAAQAAAGQAAREARGQGLGLGSTEYVQLVQPSQAA